MARKRTPAKPVRKRPDAGNRDGGVSAAARTDSTTPASGPSGPPGRVLDGRLGPQPEPRSDTPLGRLRRLLNLSYTCATNQVIEDAVAEIQRLRHPDDRDVVPPLRRKLSEV